jgi:uncharacterized cupin superfamily protein
MPKIDFATVPTRRGSDYPPPHDAPCAQRLRHVLGNAGGLTAFGVNLMHLPPGAWSSQRHWHSHDDEFVHVLSGEVVLIEDEGEQVLAAGDSAAFPAGTGNGHHLVNRGTQTAIFLEIGSRLAADRVVYADIDMMTDDADAYVRKDGSPISAISRP